MERFTSKISDIKDKFSTPCKIKMYILHLVMMEKKRKSSLFPDITQVLLLFDEHCELAGWPVSMKARAALSQRTRPGGVRWWGGSGR